MKIYPPVKRIFDIPPYQLAHYPLSDSFVSKKNKVWVKTSTQEYITQIQKATKSLLALGIQKGDTIAIISNNRTEWNIIDMAIGQAGAVSVPIYPNVSSAAYQYILQDASVLFCFLENEKLFKIIQSVHDKTPLLKNIYSFEKIDGCNDWDSFLELGKEIPHEQVQKAADSVSQEDLATITYTSGTSNTPKGVMLTHQNIISNVLSIYYSFPIEKKKKALSFLPLSHAYERLVIYTYQFLFLRIYYAESIESIARDARDIQPYVMTVVPRLLEKVYTTILDKGKALSGIKRKLFLWALELGFKYIPYQKQSIGYMLQLALARHLVFKKWKEALGGQLSIMVSGSAPLQKKLIHIFFAAGFQVAEGYGLVETAPVVSVNVPTPEGFQLGSVGKALQGVEVKLAQDGEILVKGENVMKGYYKNEQETKKAIDENGYLHTGDIGILDSQGFLKIIDRKKDIFKISSGKYVAPQNIENIMKKSRFIEHAMIFGVGEKFPSALVQLDFDYTKQYWKSKGMTFSSHKDISQNKKVIQVVRKEVQKLTKELNVWERPKKYSICRCYLDYRNGRAYPYP